MSPEQFLRVGDLFSEAALLLARDGAILAANRHVQRVGLSPPALVGRRLAEAAVTPAAQVDDYLRACARSREPVIGALVLRDDDGRELPFRCDGALADRDEATGQTQLVVRLTPKTKALTPFAALSEKIAELTGEIRRRQQTERELWDQREALRVTLASIGDGVIVTDAEARVTFLNPVASELTGWTPEEAEGCPLEQVFRIVSELTHEPTENPAVRSLREGRVVGLANHTLLIAKDGTVRAIDDSAAPVRTQDGAILGVVLVFRDVSETRRLALARSRLAALVESSGDAIIGKQFDGVVTDWNRAAEELFGYSAEETVGRPLYETTVPPELKGELLNNMARVQRGEKIEHFETVRVHKDGTRIPISLRISPIRNEEDEIIGASAIERDIRQQKQAEAQLRESELRFRQLAENIQSVFWISDPEKTQMLYVSPAYEYIWGRPCESLYENPRSFLEAIHPDDVPAVEEYLEQQRQGRPAVVQYRVVRPDGSLRWIWDRGFPVVGEEGRIERMCGLAEDITEPKRTEVMLRFLAEASASLAALVDYKSTLQKVARLAVPEFADWCTVDLIAADGTLQKLALAHFDPQRVKLAERFAQQYPPKLDASGGVGYVIRTGMPDMMQEIPDELLQAVAQDEEHLRILRELGINSYICVPLKAPGRVLGAMTFVLSGAARRYGSEDLAVAEDLAHRAAIAIENARLYHEVREADRRKDEFLAMLAHELRNPLAPIRTGLDVLSLQALGDPETIDLMQRQVEHLVRLVDDLLDVSRIIRGRVELRREAVELAPLVHRAVDALRPAIDKQEHELIVSAPDRPIWINADPVRIVQVLGNLLNNACKYTPRRGRIELTVRRMESQVEVTVRDNGIGIEPELLSKVFDLFTQAERSLDRSQGGLGIGLTLVKNLVEMHGGTVAAFSEGAGRGSRFVVRLPVVEHEAPVQPPPRLPAPTVPRRILVVDDNVSAADMLALLLTTLGPHQVETAHDGPSALALLPKLHPEIVLLDIGLPGADGYQIARAVRDDPAYDDILLVAVTGYGQDEDRRKSQAAGFDEHMVKPPSRENIEKLLTHPKLGKGK